MHGLETIIAKNKRAAKRERDLREKSERPDSFDRRIVNKPWPEDKGTSTPPHGDPLTRKD